MPRFFITDENYNADINLDSEILITGDDAHHLVSVLRAREKEKVTVCLPDKTDVICEYLESETTKNGTVAKLKVISIKENDTEPEFPISVFQGMPKGKKTDMVVQKCVELGACKIAFVYSDRAVPKYENKKEEEKKLQRLQKIADEASKQCGRGKLTEIAFYKSLDEAIPEMKKSELSFFLYENEDKTSIKNALKSDFSSVSFFIGPEGGISEREKELLIESKIPSFTLGKRILRTETAPVSVLSMILYEKEL